MMNRCAARFVFKCKQITTLAPALICVAIISLALLFETAAAQDGRLGEAFFQETIQPILRAKCLVCHGPRTQKSSYRLDVREIAFQGGDHGEAPIVPGKSHASLLLQYVSDENSDMAMPPKDSGLARLTAQESDSLRQWIEHGAAWPDSANATILNPLDWWSFQPLSQAPLPLLETDSTVHTGSIDRFVQARLAQVGLKLSPPAEPRTLARRLYFDLIGLPPAPEALDAFEHAYWKDRASAWDELVEQLLNMPQYGERWARHWLDVVHYGDTHGYDKDKLRPNAWPYRDYVIRALNTDKPYARFIEEQIAGDVLWPDTVDGIEALGFIAAGPWDFIGHAELPETKTDGKIARHLDRDDMVSNTIGTFCSLTIHCAQCHQHKFDPITQEDYYRLHAVFAALDRTDRPYYRDEATQRTAMQLKSTKTELAQAIEAIEAPLRKLAGDRFAALSQKIDDAVQSQGKPANPSGAFGYHSAVSVTQTAEKWVQVDLGAPIGLRSVVLRPCYDDFNSIGAGFGFPVRFRIEVSDDPAFTVGVTTLQARHAESSSADFKNPGLAAFVTHVSQESPVVGRYVRVTASKLAKRSNDFNFALAELEVLDASGKNVALGQEVTALDSVESARRWCKSNLTDGLFPTIANGADREKFLAERERLLLQFVSPEAKLRLEQLNGQLADVNQQLQRLPAPDLVYAGGIHHGKGNFLGTGPAGGQPRPIFLLARGQVTQPLREVAPGALAALDFQPFQFSPETRGAEGERRVALARWITHPANPLTWRSIVNRVWLYHFGRGLVDTPNDFGHNGGLPSHPELLDWLAIEFRDKGGSLKQLHRLIVKSETYQQSSAYHPEGERIDSGNALLWRQNRRRLEAEAIRDSVLAVSGKLDMTQGGPGWQDFVIEHPEHSPHYEYALADPEDPKTWRRSVYRFIVRSQTQPWMTALDCADPSMRVDKRNESLSAIQALALLNNGFMLTQAKYFAERVAQSSSDISNQVDTAYRLALGTALPESQRTPLIEFTEEHGLPYLCRLLYNLNAFTFVD
jgi:cytochrome c553